MVAYVQEYSYELTLQPADQGGGWLLLLLADGRELGRRVFPPVAGIKDAQFAADTAHDEALTAVTVWLASVEARDPSQRPRPADEGGVYLMMPDDWLLSPSRPDGKPERIKLGSLLASIAREAGGLTDEEHALFESVRDKTEPWLAADGDA